MRRAGSVCAAMLGVCLGAIPVRASACDVPGLVDYGSAASWVPAYDGDFSYDYVDGQLLAKSAPGTGFAALITQGEVIPQADFCVEVAFPAEAADPTPEAGPGFASNGNWVAATLNREGVARLRMRAGGGWKSLAPDHKVAHFAPGVAASLRLTWKAPPFNAGDPVDDHVSFYVGDELVATVSIPPDDGREIMLFTATGGRVVRFPQVVLEP